ncbi:MAG: T9SS type A sorting domain-containing protein [Patescibacteria group bacterium]
MKRLSFIILALFFVIAHFTFAQTDTVNGWSIYRKDAGVQTSSRIVTDTAYEGTHSQSFFISLGANDTVEWRKDYGQNFVTPPFFEVFLRLNQYSNNQSAAIMFQFSLLNGDTLFPIQRSGLGITALDQWLEGALTAGYYGQPPVEFSGLALKLYFNGPGSFGKAEIFFDKLGLYYNRDSIVVIDRFGDIVTGVRNSNYQIADYRLDQNYPNPFNPATNISYELLVSGFVTLKVYNILGEAVATVCEGEKSQGHYESRFESGSLPSGVYFYRLSVASKNEVFTETKRMIILK